MLRAMTSFAIPLGFLALLPVGFMPACSSDEDADSGDTQGGTSSSAGEPSASAGESSAGEPSSGGTVGDAGKSSGGTNSSAGDSAAAGDTGVAGDASVGSGLTPVDLGSASNYVVVAKSAISNVPTSVVTGDLALSPAAASYITGFSLSKVGTSWSSAQVVGSVFAANGDPPTPSVLTTAVADMMTAYTDAAGRKSPDFLNLGAGAIGELTLTPGLYKWTSTVTIPTDVTLEGGANDVWIFQVTGDLKQSAATSMVLSGGADPSHVFWQVAGVADFGTSSHAEGIVLSKTAIKLETGASINGRLLAQTAVNLAGATVTAP